MIRNRQNSIIFWVLHTYVGWILKRHFNKIIFNDIEVLPNKSVLLLANHFSFWDALILYTVNKKLFKKKFHVMVREDTTVQLKYLIYGGAFTVNKGSRDMLQSLDYATELLQDPKNLVLIFPQGKLYSNFVKDIHFEQGVSRIMTKAEGKFQLVFAATFIQYLRHKKPTASMYIKKVACAGESSHELQEAYQQHYDAAKTEQTEIVI